MDDRSLARRIKDDHIRDEVESSGTAFDRLSKKEKSILIDKALLKKQASLEQKEFLEQISELNKKRLPLLMSPFKSPMEHHELELLEEEFKRLKTKVSS